MVCSNNEILGEQWKRKKKNTGCVSKTLCAEQKKKKSQIQKSKHCMIPHIQSSRIGETTVLEIWTVVASGSREIGDLLERK